MVQVLINDLVGEVRVALDENRTESSYLSDNTDNMELNEIISSKLLEAVRSVQENCPVWMLEGEVMTTTISSNTDGSGTLSLPDDFLRLVALQLTEWDAPVFVVEQTGTQKALMQENKYTRGNPKRPVLVFGNLESGLRKLKYYSVKTSALVELALYVKIPSVITVNSQNYLKFPQILRQPIVSYCAGLVEIVRGNADQSKVFFQLAESHYS
jgi:hypothetical protein